MKTIAAALLLSLGGLMARAQEKLVPVGEGKVYKTVDGQALHLWVAEPSGERTHSAMAV